MQDINVESESDRVQENLKSLEEKVVKGSNKENDILRKIWGKADIPKEDDILGKIWGKADILEEDILGKILRKADILEEDDILGKILEKINEMEREAESLEQSENRPLTEEEREYYKEKLGWDDALLDKLSIDKEGNLYLKTRNDGKEGTEGKNGVKYERKTVVVNGVEVSGVFPVFDSTYEAQLPKDKLKDSDAKQEKECNKQLKDAIENDPELESEFTDEQLEQIENGDTPDGYTWHHNEEEGKMQLVKTENHQQNGHTGGKVIWGGGSNNR